MRIPRTKLELRHECLKLTSFDGDPDGVSVGSALVGASLVGSLVLGDMLGEGDGSALVGLSEVGLDVGSPVNSGVGGGVAIVPQLGISQ